MGNRGPKRRGGGTAKAASLPISTRYFWPSRIHSNSENRPSVRQSSSTALCSDSVRLNLRSMKNCCASARLRQAVVAGHWTAAGCDLTVDVLSHHVVLSTTHVIFLCSYYPNPQTTQKHQGRTSFTGRISSSSDEQDDEQGRSASRW